MGHGSSLSGIGSRGAKSSELGDRPMDSLHELTFVSARPKRLILELDEQLLFSFAGRAVRVEVATTDLACCLPVRRCLSSAASVSVLLNGLDTSMTIRTCSPTTPDAYVQDGQGRRFEHTKSTTRAMLTLHRCGRRADRVLPAILTLPVV